MDKQIKVEYTDNTDYRDEMFFSDMESAKNISKKNLIIQKNILMVEIMTILIIHMVMVE